MHQECVGNYWSMWWLYDADTNRILEVAHQAGQRSVEIFIAGVYYDVDLVNMRQGRKEQEGAKEASS